MSLAQTSVIQRFRIGVMQLTIERRLVSDAEFAQLVAELPADG